MTQIDQKLNRIKSGKGFNLSPCIFGLIFILLVKMSTANDDQTGVQTQPKKPNQYTLHASSENPDLFEFETEQMKGTIRLDGDYHGVTQLIDKKSGRQVIDSRYSALNLFRLMCSNRFIDNTRKMERKTNVSSHFVEAIWPSNQNHRGIITARYEITSPSSIDLTLTVESRGTYADYEIFVSSYFDKIMIPHVYLKPARGMKQSDSTLPIVPTMHELFKNTLLVFPRDAHAARLGLDGRWDPDTIQLCPVRHYEKCMTLLTDPEKKLGVLLMSHPRDSYEFSTRYYPLKEEDRFTDYSAFDFSLFGVDLLPQDKKVARIRLALTELDSQMSQPVKIYNSFLSERD